MNPQSRLAQSSILILFTLLGMANAHAAVSINYVVNNHLGAPVLLVDENQHVVWQAEYDEFGKATILLEEVEFNVRFPGQYYDKETGLTYNYYRDYDLNLGRYIQSDPIGVLSQVSDPQMIAAAQVGIPLRPSMLGHKLNHLYAYVDGNPISNTDAYGLHKGDKLFGLPKKFWQWYHRQVKKSGDPNLTKDEAFDLHEWWESLNKPGPDDAGSIVDDVKSIFIPPAIEAACLANPCAFGCVAFGFECKDPYSC